MARQSLAKYAVAVLCIVLACPAFASIDDSGLLNDVTQRFLTNSATWGGVITNYANWIFWVLATISMVWTFGLLALRKADVGEFFAEFIRFTITTGFFWWLLSNGPAMAMAIIDSLRKIGADAGGIPRTLSPSTPISIGFDIVKKAFTGLSWVHPIDNLGIILVSAAVVIAMAVVAANVLIALVTAWAMAYAGVFILGFGGARWTSEMAIGYFKAMLGMGLELMTMTLLVGVALSVIDGFYRDLDGSSVYELLLVLCVCVVLALLIGKIPARVAALAGGGSGAGANVGSIMNGAAMAAAAVATGGAAMAAGAANIAGGAQALMAAFSKAAATESSANAAASGAQSFANAAEVGGVSGQGLSHSSAGGTPLASAMGNPEGTSSKSNSTPFSTATSSEASAQGQSTETTDVEATKGTSESSPTETSHANEPPDSSSPAVKSEVSRAEAGVPAQGNSADSSSRPIDSSTAGKSTSKPRSAGDKTTSGKSVSTDPMADAAAMAVKAGKRALGTAFNVAQGTFDVTKAAATDLMDHAKDRIGETVGGKIAAAIKAREAATKQASVTATFGNDSLSAGTERTDPESEIAAFRDGKPTNT